MLIHSGSILSKVGASAHPGRFSDQALRDAGQSEGIEVVGTLWLVGEMLNARIIAKTGARAAYRAMKASDRRLPWREIEKQLNLKKAVDPSHRQSSGQPEGRWPCPSPEEFRKRASQDEREAL
ncbi:MAG: hypothetical protein M0Z39_12035, partial [Actinomycetota bacterium]|nr:hypothetical protein [Actinomycetota bacterium]